MSITPAGWYPNPNGTSDTRYWDGTQWTDHVQNYYSMSSALVAPAGTKPYTPFIWLVTLLPLLSYVSLALIDWAGYMRATMTLDLELLATVGIQYLIVAAINWLLFGACVLFAYLDWKEVRRREVPRPFHWAWAFLAPAVYSIGRSVIMRRRTGDGIAPMYLTIASIVVGTVLSLVIIVVATVAMMDEISYYSTY